VCCLFVLFAKGGCMCTYPDPASALREHMYPPTPTTNLSIYLPYPPTHPQRSLTPPSPFSLSHFTPHHTAPPHLPNPSPQHHTIPIPSVPQPSEQAHQAHQARRQPSPLPSRTYVHACPTATLRAGAAQRPCPCPSVSVSPGVSGTGTGGMQDSDRRSSAVRG
jgi:hypothetical protein